MIAAAHHRLHGFRSALLLRLETISQSTGVADLGAEPALDDVEKQYRKKK